MELHAAEEAKKRLANEKLLLEEKFSIVEKKKADEASILNIFIIPDKKIKYIHYQTIIYMVSFNRFYGC